MCHFGQSAKLGIGVSFGTLLLGCATDLKPEGRTTEDMFELRHEISQLVRPVRESSGCNLTVLSITEDTLQYSGELIVGVDDEGTVCGDALRQLNARGRKRGFRFVTIRQVPPAAADWENEPGQRNRDLIHRIDPDNDT